MYEPTRFCRACGYPLDGLPENRCPECGTRFDPNDPRTYVQHGDTRFRRLGRLAGRTAIQPLLIVPLMWLAQVLLCPFVDLGIALFAIAVNLAWRRWRPAATIVLLSPVMFSIAWAGLDYVRGTGHLTDPQRLVGGVHPVYRCQIVGFADRDFARVPAYFKRVPVGLDARRETALRAMIRVFGPMRGSYLGPYPTLQETLAALQNAAPVLIESLREDCIQFDGMETVLDAGVGAELLESAQWPAAIEDASHRSASAGTNSTPQAATWRGCILLSVPCRPARGGAHSSASLIAVIDPATGRPFAYYARGAPMLGDLPTYERY